MPSRWLSGFRRKDEHLTDETAVLFLDGELAPGEESRARQHLAGCWNCRSTLHRMDRAIRAFVAQRGRELEQAGFGIEAAPPELLPRLRLTAGSRPVSPARPSHPRLVLRMIPAVLAAALVMALLLRVGRQVLPTVSASELIARSSAQETRQLAAVRGTVLFQDVAIRKRSGPQGAWESSNLLVPARRDLAGVRQPGSDAIWNSLLPVLRNNRLDAPDLLSPAGFHAWRQSLPASREEVIPASTPSGLPAWTLRVTVTGPVPPGQIAQAELTVSASDWLPARQAIQVATAAGPETYEIIRNQLRSLPEKPPPVAPRLSPTAAGAALLPPVRGLGEAEVDAFLALHELEACRRDTLEVLRTETAVKVVGIVETEERRRELDRELARIPGVRTEIVSAERSARRNWPGAAISDFPPLRFSSGSILLEGILQRYFAPTTRRADLGREIARFANHAVRLAAAARGEALALRALSDTYPERRDGGSRPLSRRMEPLVRDHVARLQEHTDALRWLLHPIQAGAWVTPGAAPLPEEPPAGWEEIARRLAAAADRCDELAGILFAGLDPHGHTAESALQELERELVRQRETTHSLERRAARLLAPGPEEASRNQP